MVQREIDYQAQIDFIKLHNPKNSNQLLAGVWAEKQMAYELKARLGNHEELIVLNDLKIDYNGGTAQIDHLVLSPYCMYLVETKSCSGTVYINDMGEFQRNYKPINSPIEQSKRHEQILLNILNDNLDKFLGKVLGFQKRLGAYQRLHYVAISEKGQVKGQRKKFPEVMKYDLIAGKILDDYNERHQPSAFKRFTNMTDDNFRLMNIEELFKFARFLRSINIEETLEEKFRIKPEPKVESPVESTKEFLSSYQGACTKCNSTNIQVYNNYGYWVNCQDCEHKEKFSAQCPNCGSTLKLNKVKGEYKISCTCGFSAGYIFVGAGEQVPVETEAEKLCLKCNSPMVLRTAKRGANAGKEFWGCSNYPKCKYMESKT